MRGQVATSTATRRFETAHVAAYLARPAIGTWILRSLIRPMASGPRLMLAQFRRSTRASISGASFRTLSSWR